MVKRAIARVNEACFAVAKVAFRNRNGTFFDRDRYIIVVEMAGTREVQGQNPKAGV